MGHVAQRGLYEFHSKVYANR